ncbi:hypothetical protein [Vibrio vulnificus]|uniref:hypothetical protein n=1 Tax=Vibrio vulnificus TaxID=672 RepID=UPI0032428CB9
MIIRTFKGGVLDEFKCEYHEETLDIYNGLHVTDALRPEDYPSFKGEYFYEHYKLVNDCFVFQGLISKRKFDSLCKQLEKIRGESNE